jgi:hypothetical protein
VTIDLVTAAQYFKMSADQNCSGANSIWSLSSRRPRSRN